MSNELPIANDGGQEVRLAGLTVFFASFGLYLITTSPGVYWLDSSEFVAGGYTLGVPHPPGHPLYMVLAKLVSFLPMGSIAFRINLLSALLGAGCVWLTFHLSLLLIRSMNSQLSNGLSSLYGAIAAIVFAISGAMWFQSVRAEVYTLNTLITLGATVLVVRWFLATPEKDTAVWNGLAPLYCAVAVLGLGLANHHYLVLFAIPPLLLLVWGTARGRSDTLRIGRLFTLVFTGAIGLLLYAYLPIRGASDTVINWVTPTTFERFIDAITADVFQQSVTKTEGPGVAANLYKTLELIADQLHFIHIIIAGIGITVLFHVRTFFAGFVLFALLLNLMTKALMDFDPTNPDAWGYLQLSHSLVAASVGLGLAGISSLLMNLPTTKDSGGTPNDEWKVILWLTGGSIGFQGISLLCTEAFGMQEGVGLTAWCDLLFTFLGIAAVLALCRLFFQIAGQTLSQKYQNNTKKWASGIALFLITASLCVITLQYTQHADKSDIGSFRATEKFEDATFQEVPPGGILMASHFSIFFNHWHAQLVNGRRPDITMFNQTFDAKLYDGVPYVERLKRLYPRWNSIFDAYLSSKAFPVDKLLTLSSTEPIFLEADPALRSAFMLNAMHGRGITFQLGGAPTHAPPHTSWASLYSKLSPEELEDFGTWSLLLLHHFSGAIVHLRNGEIDHTFDEASRGEQIKSGALWDGLRRYGTHLKQMRSNPILYQQGIQNLRTVDFWTQFGGK